MKKLLSFLILSLIYSSLLAAEFEVVNFAVDPTDHVNEYGKQILDQNGNACAVLRIETDLDEKLYLAYPRTFKKVVEGGIPYLFINSSKRLIRLNANGYMPVEYKTPIAMQKGMTYVVKIKAKDEILGNIPVVIQSEPVDAEKIINGRNLGSGEAFKLRKGKWNLQLKKHGYKTIVRTIEVSSNSFLFKDLQLDKIYPLSFSVASKPDGASIFIDEQNYGRTPAGNKILPGEYTLTIDKYGYFPIEEKIEIRENNENKFSYKLKKNTGIINFKIQPATAKVEIDGKIYADWQKIEIPAKIYSARVFADGYRSSLFSVEVLLGKKQTKKINLEPKLGDLSFSVQPANAKVQLLKNGEVIKSWTGNRQVTKLLEGEYTIVAEASGYKTYKKTMRVNDKQTTKFKALFEKGSDLPPPPFFTNSIGMEFILVEKGSFMMGSNKDCYNNKPIRKAIITRDYYIGKYEVTQKQWKKIMGNNPSKFKSLFGKTKNNPIENISWSDLQKFINKLNEKEGINSYRLPTDAEWEFAARGGNKSKGYTCSGANCDNYEEMGDVAWYWSNANKTQNVGKKKANELDIYDMSGNVWEWCLDWHDNGYYSKSLTKTQSETRSDPVRVLRGGGWRSFSCACSVFARIDNIETSRDNDIGFRLVREVE